MLSSHTVDAWNDEITLIENFTKNLPILEDDTKDIIQYVEKSSGNKKKKFNFWKLLESND